MNLAGRTPESCPALVLNADFRPLSYFPLSLWSWQDTLKAVFLDRVDVVAEYDTVVRSASFQMKLPSVVSLRTYVTHARSPAFTRFNVFLRDGFACQYCGSGNRDLLTFDHVIPRARGGRTTWENIVAACSPCNLKKGGRMPTQAKMHPARKPVRPTMYELNERGRAFPPNYLHESWQDFLYWDSELEP
jgi:5-methylcytosine-specific restriction endonuclease McrA